MRNTASLDRPAVDFAPLDDPSPRRVSVAAAIESPGALPAIARVGHDSSRLLGTLVHRLVRRLGLNPEIDVDSTASDLLKATEAVDISDSETVCRNAANAYRALCSMTDVRDLYHSGAALHELPFTMTIDGRIVRGTIDCIVEGRDVLTVLELKTGHSRPEHARQVELYGKAVQAMHPGRRVETRVIYLGEAVILDL